MPIDTSFLRNAGELVSCDECGDRFRVFDLGGGRLSAMGDARIVEHYDARTGTKCDVEFYCSGACADANAAPGLAKTD